MDDILARLQATLASTASLGGYPFPERHDAWLERLKLNLPELGSFDSLRPVVDLGLQAPPGAPPLAGGAPLTVASTGVASVARVLREAPAEAGGPARSALAAARARPELKAFISLVDDAEIDRAVGEASERQARGEDLALFGVPLAVKDLMAVKGLAQTNGTRQDASPARGRASTADASAVARLREAGAIVIGTTNLHELAYGITSANPHYGHVVNPHSAGHLAGGSSGGSAAAVAAGIVPLAIGTDTAGSIRVPASCCGIVGFKPSFDAIPRHGAQTLGASLDHLGPMARSVADAALMFAIMAGLPPRTADPAPLAGLRIGVPRQYFFDPIGDDVARAVEAALRLIAADGARLVPVDLAGVENSAALQFITLCSEATDLHWQRLVSQPETLGEDVRVRLEIGQFLPAAWYVRAQRGRAELASMFDDALDQVDLLVTPTMRIEPPPNGTARITVGGRDLPLHAAVTALTMPFNLTGMPALTLDCGRGDHGLPIGLQLAGRRRDDWRVLGVGARIEHLLAGAGQVAARP